uniref:Uncharacterized protein n=1 Tax=Arundo donax TaxID=35708 RepID=A0A0A9EWP5_ARUDO
MGMRPSSLGSVPDMRFPWRDRLKTGRLAHDAGIGP